MCLPAALSPLLGLALAAALPATSNAQTRPCHGAGERPWLDRSLTPECRADLLLARLATTQAKLAALANEFRDYGVEPATVSDGPVGPTRWPEAISLPAPMALAASFDPHLMAEVGTLVGREFRLAGQRNAFGPTLDISRSWRFGRTAENYGEDPFLTGTMAVPYVRAIQAQGVAVTVKHFAAYTQEQGRTGDSPAGERPAVDVVVPERALRETYLPAFRAAVVDGGALGVMCAFPRINGVYACENEHLLGILKRDWGFRGVVTPDFPDAQRTVVAAVNAGLDAGNFGLPRAAPPTGPVFPVPGGIDLGTAVRSGRVTADRLDDLVRRTLVRAFAVDGGPAPAPIDPTGAEALAVRAATEGTVLLRNERGILPFGADVRSIAVIGAQAGDRAQTAIVGSAFIAGRPAASALSAITARARNVSVTYSKGTLGLDALTKIPTGLLRSPDGHAGLRADYVGNANLDFSGPVLTTRVEPNASSLGSSPVPGLPANHQWSVRWTGVIVPRATGVHDFTLSGAGSARLFVGGKLIARYDRVDFATVEHGAATLSAGRPVEVRVEYTPREAAPIPLTPMFGTTLGAIFDLGWAEPDGRIPRAVAAAKAADVAVVFAANRQGEGADRAALNLPNDQDRLIEAVAATNPRTIVVLSTGGPVAMPWRDKVGGIIEMWYSGQAFPVAATRLLFGDAAPGGHLPITFPADEGQGPAAELANYPGVSDAAGILQTVRFDEGTLVGHRWYAAYPDQKPLYPFGFGLSYAPAPAVSDTAARSDGDDALVAMRLTNPGPVSTTRVVQVYLALRGDAERRAPKLAAFEKVSLAPGETKAVELRIPPSAFDVWDERTNTWASYRGTYELRVGDAADRTAYRKELRR